MIGTKCPGQDMRYWTADDIHESSCPTCGAEIEFWKTDIRVRCPHCREKVANPRFNLGCAQWCAYAEQCLGPAAKGLKAAPLKEELKKELVRLSAGDRDQEERLTAIFDQAEEKMQDGGEDTLPVIAGALIASLEDLNLIDGPEEYASYLVEEKKLPRLAINEALEAVKAYRQQEKGEKLKGPAQALAQILP